MLERAREKARETSASVDLRRGDAEDLQFADDSFDLVTARHLIWTLPNPEEAIREWSRVVKSGGEVVLIEGHWDFEEPWDEYEVIHSDLPMYQEPRPDELVDFFDEHGLQRTEHESLMDPILWGDGIEYEMSLVRGKVPR